jgi:hypothetical protein
MPKACPLAIHIGLQAADDKGLLQGEMKGGVAETLKER